MSCTEGAAWSASTLVAVGELARRSLPVRRDVSLAPFTTYRVGGPAAGFLLVSSIADLDVVRQVLTATDVPVLVVGRGSNLLVADRGFDGLAVHLTEAFDRVEITPGDRPGAPALVELGGATLLPVAARATVRAGLTGFEWAVGVPGSVGGAVRMNAGGHGSDMASSLRRVRVFNLRSGGPIEWDLDHLALGYRHSALGVDDVVLDAELALAAGDRAQSERLLAEIVQWRRAHQPGGSNAGSVFANPVGASAGELIEQAGLKGFRIGSAEVSAKHANFIQADPGGSADDVHRLLRHVQSVVRQSTGVDLRPENRLVGFEPPTGEGP